MSGKRLAWVSLWWVIRLGLSERGYHQGGYLLTEGWGACGLTCTKDWWGAFGLHWRKCASLGHLEVVFTDAQQSWPFVGAPVCGGQCRVARTAKTLIWLPQSRRLLMLWWTSQDCLDQIYLLRRSMRLIDSHFSDSSIAHAPRSLRTAHISQGPQKWSISLDTLWSDCLLRPCKKTLLLKLCYV